MTHYHNADSIGRFDALKQISGYYLENEIISATNVEAEISIAIVLNDRQKIHHLLSETSADLVPEGCGPLHMAAALGYHRCVEYLITLNIDYATLNLQDQLGWSPLMHAVANKHVRVAQLLLRTGLCDVNVQDNYEQNSLHIVTQSHCDCSKALVGLLLAHDSAVDTPDCQLMTPFLRAVENENASIAKLLHSRTCDYMASNRKGATALHIALQKCNEELVHWLLSIGCEVNASDKSSQSPLMTCVLMRKHPHLIFRLMRMLLEAGASVNHRDSCGNSVLLLATGNPAAIRRHHIELLLVTGANVNCENMDGLTPLWQAVYDGIHYSDRIKVIQLLLQENCDLNVASRGKLLFTSGLDSVYCYENAMTPFEVAMDSGFYDAAKMLILGGCDINPEMYLDIQSTEVAPELQWFKEIITNPCSLQQQCRLLIRKCLGKSIKNTVRKLPLPEKMKSYILLDDVILYF